MVELNQTPFDSSNLNRPAVSSTGEHVMLPGTIVGNQFRVEKTLGEGGMGSVFQCHDLVVDRTVAVKFLHSHLAKTDRWLLRFRQEAKAVGRLDHPNIVRVHQFSVETESPFIVMDFVQGTNLQDKLKTRGALAQSEAITVAINIADALEHAHSHGIVHRDLKPSNIVICNNETFDIKVLDFGIAKVMASDENKVATLTQTGEVFGTPTYISPEQLLGKEVDGRADQYAFACVLYECLTGAPPFMGDSVFALMSKHIHESPLPLNQASLGNSFPDWLDAIVQKALSKDPQQRFDSMGELKEALLAEGRNSAPVPTVEIQAKENVRPPIWVFTCIFGAIITTVAIALMTFHNASTHQTRKASASEKSSAQEIATPESASNAKQYPIHETRDDAILQREADSKYTAMVQAARASGLRNLGFPQDPMISNQALQALNGYPDLQQLYLTNCSYLDDQSMEILRAAQYEHPTLQSIDISATEIGDGGLRTLAQIPTLMYVRASQCPRVRLTGLNALCLQSPNLMGLTIDHNEQLPPIALKYIAQAKNLKVLSLDANKCHTGIQYLTSLPLTLLSLTRCNIDDADVEEIAKIESLEQLRLAQNPALTKRSLDAILQLKHLKTVRLSQGQISAEDTAAFQRAMSERNVVVDLSQ